MEMSSFRTKLLLDLMRLHGIHTANVWYSGKRLSKGWFFTVDMPSGRTTPVQRLGYTLVEAVDFVSRGNLDFIAQKIYEQKRCRNYGLLL